MSDDDQDDAKTALFTPKPKRKRVSQSPLQAVSMKTPVPTMESHKTPALPRPNLSSRAEIKIPQNLGYLAPPADPRRARARRTRDIVLVISLSIIVACVIALVIWFVAK
jgi:hypothetical protein